MGDVVAEGVYTGQMTTLASDESMNSELVEWLAPTSGMAHDRLQLFLKPLSSSTFLTSTTVCVRAVRCVVNDAGCSGVGSVCLTTSFSDMRGRGA